jgi:hypothetical protein
MIVLFKKEKYIKYTIILNIFLLIYLQLILNKQLFSSLYLNLEDLFSK